jgi:glycosyltransferase involved in cell wall biosynthesis
MKNIFRFANRADVHNRKIICNISKNAYPLVLSKHIQNIETFTGWLQFWDEVILIVQSPDFSWHESSVQTENGKITAYYVPMARSKWLGNPLFILLGIYRGLVLHKNKNITLWDGSDNGIFGGLIGVVLKIATRRPLLIEIQGEIFDMFNGQMSQYKAYLLRWIGILSIKMATHVRCVSDSTYQKVISFGVPKNRVSIIYSRCNTIVFSRDRFIGNREQLREKYSFNNSDTVFLFVGRFVVFKGLSYLLHAFSLVVKENPMAKLWLVGDGELRREIELLAKQLNIDGSVIFYGSADYNNIAEIMFCSDLFVLSSLDEGLPRVILEAMSINIPVIATDVGGISSIIEHDVTGVLVKSKDVIGLSAAMRIYFTDPEYFNNLARNANISVREKFDYDVSMNKFTSMFRQIVP